MGTKPYPSFVNAAARWRHVSANPLKHGFSAFRIRCGGISSNRELNIIPVTIEYLLGYLVA